MGNCARFFFALISAVLLAGCGGGSGGGDGSREISIEFPSAFIRNNLINGQIDRSSGVVEPLSAELTNTGSLVIRATSLGPDDALSLFSRPREGVFGLRAAYSLFDVPSGDYVLNPGGGASDRVTVDASFDLEILNIPPGTRRLELVQPFSREVSFPVLIAEFGENEAPGALSFSGIPFQDVADVFQRDGNTLFNLVVLASPQTSDDQFDRDEGTQLAILEDQLLVEGGSYSASFGVPFSRVSPNIDTPYPGPILAAATTKLNGAAVAISFDETDFIGPWAAADTNSISPDITVLYQQPEVETDAILYSERDYPIAMNPRRSLPLYPRISELTFLGNSFSYALDGPSQRFDFGETQVTYQENGVPQVVILAYWDPSQRNRIPDAVLPDDFGAAIAASNSFQALLSFADLEAVSNFTQLWRQPAGDILGKFAIPAGGGGDSTQLFLFRGENGVRIQRLTGG